MPIFEYECNDCKKTFEKIIMSKDKIVICSNVKCKSENVRKVISTATFKINGYNAKNNYSRKNVQSDQDIINNGPIESINNMKNYK